MLADPGRRGLKVVGRGFTGPVGLEGTLQFPMRAYPGEAQVRRKYGHILSCLRRSWVAPVPTSTALLSLALLFVPPSERAPKRAEPTGPRSHMTASLVCSLADLPGN